MHKNQHGIKWGERTYIPPGGEPRDYSRGIRKQNLRGSSKTIEYRYQLEKFKRQSEKIRKAYQIVYGHLPIGKPKNIEEVIELNKRSKPFYKINNKPWE